MAFGFGDIGQMFGGGMAQYGQGLDRMRAMPMANKMMMAGQALHGGAQPADMAGAAMRMGDPGVPGATMPPVAPPPAAAPAQDPTQSPGDGSDFLTGLLPLLMKNGFGTGLGGSTGLASGGLKGLTSGSGLGMGLAGLFLGKH